MDIGLHFLRVMEGAVVSDHQDSLLGIRFQESFQILDKMGTTLARGPVAGEVAGFQIQAAI